MKFTKFLMNLCIFLGIWFMGMYALCLYIDEWQWALWNLGWAYGNAFAYWLNTKTLKMQKEAALMNQQIEAFMRRNQEKETENV